MPAILERLVSQLKQKGYNESSAYAIATSTLQKSGNLQKGSQKPTAKGIRRGSMTPAQRATDRAMRNSKNKHPMDYLYNPRTNRSTLRRGRKR
jgi:hypothetical protein